MHFGRSAPAPLDLLYGILPSAILYTWVYNNTRRSVLAVVILHLMQNFSGELLGLAEEVRPIRLGLEIALALAVIAWWGPATLRRGEPIDDRLAPHVGSRVTERGPVEGFDRQG